jgi:hypothetical protein
MALRQAEAGKSEVELVGYATEQNAHDGKTTLRRDEIRLRHCA